MKRMTAGLIALAVVFALSAQFWLNGSKPGLEGYGARSWDLMRYFTILTNALVGVLMIRIARGAGVRRRWLGTAALNIAMVGIVYQILLAPPEPFTGLNWWSDFLFHAGVPLAMVLWWAVYAAPRALWGDLPWWLLWPVGYCAYILIRAGLDGNYPYFFIDAARFGYGRVALNVLGLVLVFAASGALMIAAGKGLARLRGTAQAQ
jgi:hypothetical protein